jgi:hypothetical protein
MATEADQLERKEPQEGRTKTELTLTGLLMEGLGVLVGDSLAEHGGFTSFP